MLSPRLLLPLLLAAVGAGAVGVEQLLAEGHPLWGLSASRRAAFRGHGPVLAGAEQPSASLGAMASEAARRPPPPPSPPARWFDEQVVDHFVPATERTHWSQRYYVNDTLWGGPGFPVFMYIGGESAESGHALSGELFMSHLAEQHQALMVDVEHRFYGASHPTKDMGDESIALLSSQQALADLAHFVSWFAATFGSGGTGDSPWVCFGGSYPGDLSAWFRLKYPHLVVGAVASSAPVLAVQDMPSYMDVVGRSLRRDGGDRCWEKVANATAALANMLALGPSGEEAAMRHFGTCEPMTALNAATFVGDAMGTLQGIVQGNHIYPGGNMTTISIMCGQIEKANTTLDALLPLSTPPKNGTHCRDNSYAKAIAQLRNATWGNSMDRQWTWQTCNEFGFFQSAGSEESPFHPLNSTLSVDYYLQQCKDAYKLPHPFTAVPTDFTNVRDIPYPRPSAWRSDRLSGARSRTTGRARWAPRAWSCRTARWTRGTRSRWSSP